MNFFLASFPPLDLSFEHGKQTRRPYQTQTKENTMTIQNITGNAQEITKAVTGFKPARSGSVQTVFMTDEHFQIQLAFLAAYQNVGKVVETWKSARTDEDKAAAAIQIKEAIEQAKKAAKEVGKAAENECLAILPLIE